MALVDGLNNKGARVPVGILIEPSGQLPAVQWRVGTALLHELPGTEADKYSLANLTSFQGILKHGATWLQRTPSEASFTIRNGLIFKDGGNEHVEITSAIRGAQTWEGARIVVTGFVEDPGGAEEWATGVLFEGVVQSAQITPDGVEVRCVETQLTTQIPFEEVSANSMNYSEPNPDPEGAFPEGASGQIAPLAYGRMGMQARDSAHDASSDTWGDNRGYVLAPALGLKVPMVPVAMLADLHHHRLGDANFSEGGFLLFSVGSTWTGRSGGIELPWWQEDPNPVDGYTQGLNTGAGDLEDLFPHEALPNSLSTRWFATTPGGLFKLSFLFTWNRELGVAMPYCKDMSTDQLTAPHFTTEFAYASIKDYTQKRGVGAHTTKTGRGSRHHIWSLQRIDPNFVVHGVPPWGEWTGLVQSVFLQGDQLDEEGGTTGGVVFGTTAGVIDPLACIDGKPGTFAILPVGERLSIQLVAEGPQLGEPMYARVGVITGGATTALQAAFRYTPQHLLVPTLGPAERAEWNIAAVSATQFTHNPNAAATEPFFYFHFWGRNEDASNVVAG